MDFTQLKIFRDIAYVKNFSKAAKLNFITQPSVSTRVKQLEEELGLKLFERASKKVSLTRDGQILLPYVEEILSRCEKLVVAASEIKGDPSGDLSIAAINSIGIFGFSSALGDFISQYPKINVHLRYERCDVIYDLVLTDKIDLGLVAYPSPHPKIDITDYGYDNLVLAVPPSHHLAGKKSVSIESLSGEAFVLFEEGVPTGNAIRDILGKHEVEVSVRMVNDNINALKSAVAAGLGISILPGKSFQGEVLSGTLVEVQLSDIQTTRPHGIITLADSPISHPAKLFINHITSKDTV